MDGARTYTKTSDSSGYIYLSRSELPEWYDGAPSAADDPENIDTGVKPSSFSFGGTVVTEDGKIASTCKVPYQVGLEMTLTGGSLRKRSSLVKYEIHRIVEGEREEQSFLECDPRGFVDDYRGTGFLHNVPSCYKYYRNEGAAMLLRKMYETASSTSTAIPPSSATDSDLLDYFSTLANLFEGEVPGFRRAVGEEYFGSPSYGDGENPSQIGVYETFTYVSKGSLLKASYKPDYGLKVLDEVREVHIPSITPLPSTVLKASYVWKSGHTTLTFELDWGAIDALEVADDYSGRWEGSQYIYDYCRFKDLSYRPSSVFSTFRAKGRFNGSLIDSKTGISWKSPIVFTDIYDDFSTTIDDVGGSYVLFDGLSGTFSYDSSQDDENGNGTAYLFGCAISKTEDKSGE